jgi:LacI family transcriptional regulator
VCNSDRAAYGLTQQLKARNLLVGKDISLVGYDNDIFSIFNDPPLTTVEVDIPQMTLKAVALLMGSINHSQEQPINLSIMGKIIERNSVVNLKDKDVK